MTTKQTRPDFRDTQQTNLQFTLHAQQRIQQRGCRKNDACFICEYGEDCGAGIHFMSRRNEHRIAHEINRLIRQGKLDEKKGKQVKTRMGKLRGLAVVEKKGLILTVYRPDRWKQRRFLKGMHPRSTA